jgi:hypothetical protein
MNAITGIYIDPEDGGRKFLRNIDIYLSYCTASNHGRSVSSDVT